MLINEGHDRQLFDGTVLRIYEPHLYCNVCGKDITNTNSSNVISFHSVLNRRVIDLDICLSCFDKLLDKLQPLCKINPITEYQPKNS